MAKRAHTAEFKHEEVRYASKPGLSRPQAAKELGICPNLLQACQEKLLNGTWEGKSNAGGAVANGRC